jgi:RNA polymerase sigma-70 factor (ECF subfamily)
MEANGRKGHWADRLYRPKTLREPTSGRDFLSKSRPAAESKVRGAGGGVTPAPAGPGRQSTGAMATPHPERPEQQPDRREPAEHLGSRGAASQERFLKLFLASECEVRRYVSALAPARADAEEIMQQTAVELWRKFEQFDLSLPFTPLACRFALNVSKQWLARKRRWQGVLAADLAERIADRRSQVEPVLAARLRHLDACLGKLPVEQRRIIDGYYFQKRSIDEVAAEARRTVTAAYKAIQRIRQALEECIARAERGERGEAGG